MVRKARFWFTGEFMALHLGVVNSGTINRGSEEVLVYPLEGVSLLNKRQLILPLFCKFESLSWRLRSYLSIYLSRRPPHRF
jgi:hypothetical protein